MDKATVDTLDEIIAGLEVENERLREANRILKEERSRLLNELRSAQDSVNAIVRRALNE